MVRKGQIQGQAYIDMKKLDDGTVGFQKKKNTTNNNKN